MRGESKAFEAASIMGLSPPWVLADFLNGSTEMIAGIGNLIRSIRSETSAEFTTRLTRGVISRTTRTRSSASTVLVVIV